MGTVNAQMEMAIVRTAGASIWICAFGKPFPPFVIGRLAWRVFDLRDLHITGAGPVNMRRSDAGTGIGNILMAIG